MADLTRGSTPSPDMSNPSLPLIVGIADVDLVAGDAVYLKSDGEWAKAVGTADNAAAKFGGIVAKSASAGEACTILLPGWRIMNYSTGLTPGARYFVGATAGNLADAATTGGNDAVAMAVSATDILITAFGV